MQTIDEGLLDTVEGFYGGTVNAVNQIEALDAKGSKTGQSAVRGAGREAQPDLYERQVAGPNSIELEAAASEPAVISNDSVGNGFSINADLSGVKVRTPQQSVSDTRLRLRGNNSDIASLNLLEISRQVASTPELINLSSPGPIEISHEQLALFTAMARHLDAAKLLQSTLEYSCAMLMAEVLEALSLLACVCDRSGQVQAMTHSAQQMLGSNTNLRVVNRVLQATSRAETQALRQAIEAAAHSDPIGSHAAGTTVLIGKGTDQLRILEVIALRAREGSADCSARVLVVVKSAARFRPPSKQLIQSFFGFTSAEAEVALGLAQGLSTAEIAKQRGSAIGTVRKQVRAVCEKMGCHRQGEITAALSTLC